MSFGSTNVLVATLFTLAMAGADAQKSGASSSSTPAAVATFTVEVGKGGHAFRPDVVQAGVGDIVTFNFYPLNHSVVRAA